MRPQRLHRTPASHHAQHHAASRAPTYLIHIRHHELNVHGERRLGEDVVLEEMEKEVELACGAAPLEKGADGAEQHAHQADTEEIVG